LLCFIWGSSFILTKESKAGMTAMQIGAVRIFSAGLVFLPFALYHIGKVPRDKIAKIGITGIFGNLLPAFLFPAAIMHIDSSLAGILNSLTPLCVVVLGMLFFKQKIATGRIIGVCVGFVGLCLLTLTRTDIQLNNIGYASLVLLAALSYGLNVNLVGYYLKNVPPFYAATISLAFMLIPSGIILLATDFIHLDFGEVAVQWAVVNSVTLGIVSSAFATAIFYFLIQRGGGLFASLVTYGIPFVAIFWGIRDGEKTGWMTFVSLGIILAGVFLANRQQKKREEQ
jgi:drug/metabolite transporter (DMT)-like permease